MSTRHELTALISQFAPSDGDFATTIPSLSLHRHSSPTIPYYGIYKPALIMVIQGAKRVILANETYDYDSSRCLITSIDLPVVSWVTQASAEVPYLCLILNIAPAQIRELMTEASLPAPNQCERGMCVSPLSAPLLDATLRLVQLLASPQDIPILAPLIQREIVYRLLTSDQGKRLRQIALMDSQLNRIAKAIEWIKGNFTERLRIEELAQMVNMSPSSLHHHFKSVTAMSPLQYQKQLRLQEARRLLLTEMLDAASVSYQVGYKSPSQFSREYSLLYGAPPLRDVEQLRLHSMGLQ